MKTMSQFIKALWHPGPISTLMIIKTITLSVTYCSLMWWPPEKSLGGLLCLTIFLVLSGLVMFNFFSAISFGPGYVPDGWRPDKEEDKDKVQYCVECKAFKAPRSHHCRKCGHCILKLDHHCVWINGCVGHLNHSHFIFFLLCAVIGCAQATIILGSSIYRAIYRPYYEYHMYSNTNVPIVRLGVYGIVWCLFSMGCAVGVTLGVSFLLYYQLKSILSNRTMIEEWIEEKAVYRRKYDTNLPPFVYPYDLGKKQNFFQVLNNLSCKPVGDGIQWPVCPGTNQFTLTLEQIEQKKEKRARSKEYIAIEDFSGAWFPISKGLCTFCRPPCTDEARMPLKKDERIIVTRWKKYWLYGTKVKNENLEAGDEPHGQNQSLLKKGWFPSRCVIEVTNISSSNSNCQVGQEAKQSFSNHHTSKKVKKNN